MVAHTVWKDFVRLQDEEQPARQGRDRLELFARWKCPHCPTIVRALASSAPDNKSHACRQHFWGCEPCPNRPSDDLRGKPKQKQAKSISKEPAQAVGVPVMMADYQMLQQQLAQIQADQARERDEQARERARAERHRVAMREALGLSDHSSDDEAGVKKLKRKLDSTVTETYASVANAGRYSPQRDGETPIVFGRRIKARVGDDVKEAATAKGLRVHCERVNECLGLSPKAAPADALHKVSDIKSTLSRLRSERNGLKFDLDVERQANGTLEETLEKERKWKGCVPHGRDKRVDAILKEFHPDKIRNKFETQEEMATAFAARLNALKS